MSIRKFQFSFRNWTSCRQETKYSDRVWLARSVVLIASPVKHHCHKMYSLRLSCADLFPFFSPAYRAANFSPELHIRKKYTNLQTQNFHCRFLEIQVHFQHFNSMGGNHRCSRGDWLRRHRRFRRGLCQNKGNRTRIPNTLHWLSYKLIKPKNRGSKTEVEHFLFATVLRTAVGAKQLPISRIWGFIPR